MGLLRDAEVTSSQAIEILSEEMETVPETEIIVEETSFDENIAESMVIMEEATQPPTLSPYSPNSTQSNKWNFTIVAFLFSNMGYLKSSYAENDAKFRTF